MCKTLHYIYLSILLFSSALHAQEPSPDEATFATTLKEAQSAFRNYKPERAVELLEQVLNSPNESHQIKAGKYLAKLYADIFNDYEKAKNINLRTIAWSPEDSDGYLIFSKIASDYHDHSLAIANGHLAIQKAVSKDEKIAAYSSFGEILLSATIDERISDTNVKEIAIDQDQLNTTITHLNRVLSLDPSQIELLKTKFALEILAGNGADALTTWKRYFNYSERSNPLLIKTFDELKNALENNTGTNSPESKIALAKALANARNYELSMTIIKTLSQKDIDSDVRIQEIVNYHRFLQKADELIINFYRESVTSGENPKAFRTLFIANARELWDSYLWKEEPKEFSLDNVEIELDQRFGTCLRIGPANGWFSVTLGHKVIEYNTTIEQYGFKGELAFRSADYVISNGLIGWYFDNDHIGGWESDQIIYQVRPSYLHGPYKAWNTVSDPIKVKERQDAIKQALDNDITLSSLEVIIFPGMLDAMEFRAQKELYDDLKKNGFQGAQLREKYLSEFENLTFDNSILSHEGRHFIDAKIAKESGIKLTSEELEFRGKLSEIAFAKYPFMALSSILGGGIHNSSPHGIANKRIVVALYDWMDKNWEEVKGVNPSLPKAPQLHLISNQQLIGIIKSLDPLVKK